MIEEYDEEFDHQETVDLCQRRNTGAVDKAVVCKDTDYEGGDKAERDLLVHGADRYGEREYYRRDAEDAQDVEGVAAYNIADRDRRVALRACNDVDEELR